MSTYIKYIIGCILVFTICLIVSPSGYADKEKSFTTHTIVHEGIERTYHVHVPKNISQSRKKPLVIVLHGGGGRGLALARAKDPSNFTDPSDERGFIVVFPEGVNRQWNDGRKQIFNKWKKVVVPADDVGFISMLIDHLTEKYRIDRDRIFVTGISNGGFMSFRLALDLADKITAIAPVTAQLSKAVQHKKPSRPVSVMIFNGTDDPLVPYRGGDIKLFKYGRSRGEILSTDETIKRFVKYNGCRGNPKRQKLADRDRNDQTRVYVESYSECRNQTKVVLVQIKGGGHTWPGGVQYLPVRRVGRVSRDINATQMIVDFFLSR